MANEKNVSIVFVLLIAYAAAASLTILNWLSVAGYGLGTTDIAMEAVYVLIPLALALYLRKRKKIAYWLTMISALLATLINAVTALTFGPSLLSVTAYGLNESTAAFGYLPIFQLAVSIVCSISILILLFPKQVRAQFS